MAAHETEIQELRTQLQASRWRMHDTLQRLEDQVNVPQRIKTRLATHPLKWAALALGLGFFTATMTPWIMRLSKNSMVRRWPALVLRLALMAALPALKKRAVQKTSVQVK